MRSILLCVIGLIYGGLLALVGMGAANGGDGPMLPLYVFGSPLFFPLLFFAPIVVWTLVGFSLGEIDNSKYSMAFPVIMGIHYLGLLPYIILLGDWEKIQDLSARSPASIVVLVVLYASGQIISWTYCVTHRRVSGEIR